MLYLRQMCSKLWRPEFAEFALTSCMLDESPALNSSYLYLNFSLWYIFWQDYLKTYTFALFFTVPTAPTINRWSESQKKSSKLIAIISLIWSFFDEWTMLIIYSWCYPTLQKNTKQRTVSNLASGMREWNRKSRPSNLAIFTNSYQM